MRDLKADLEIYEKATPGHSIPYQIGYDKGFKEGYNKGLEDSHTIINLSTINKPMEVLVAKDAELFNVLRESLNQMLVNKNAALREQTDIQRQSIQDLSCQVAEYREALEKLARLGNEPHYGNSIGNEMAKKALATPDPGVKVKAVVKAAKYAVECWDKGFGTPQAMPESKQALADFEGGTSL